MGRQDFDLVTVENIPSASINSGADRFLQIDQKKERNYGAAKGLLLQKDNVANAGLVITIGEKQFVFDEDAVRIELFPGEDLESPFSGVRINNPGSAQATGVRGQFKWYKRS